MKSSIILKLQKLDQQNSVSKQVDPKNFYFVLTKENERGNLEPTLRFTRFMNVFKYSCQNHETS